jgi:hypothetical protein
MTMPMANHRAHSSTSTDNNDPEIIPAVIPQKRSKYTAEEEQTIMEINRKLRAVFEANIDETLEE